MFISLLLIFTILGISVFISSIPKKLQFRKRKNEALENIALVNRAIMGNLAGDSSIRKNWNGKFSDMKDSEIKSFRKLDTELNNQDIEISQEKYEEELSIIKEIYELKTTKSNY